MFEDIMKTFGINQDEEQVFFEIMMGQVLKVNSPFEVDRTIDFPHKDELGGVVMKFIGGGSAYFKLQKEMPSEEEVKSVFEVCQFLKESFGDYIIAFVMCQPDIEIRDIDVSLDETIDVTYVSLRKSNSKGVIEDLTKKVKNKEEFNIEDHIMRFLVPFMGRSNNAKFKRKYLKFLCLFLDAKKELPNSYSLVKFAKSRNKQKSSIKFNRIF